MSEKTQPNTIQAAVEAARAAAGNLANNAAGLPTAPAGSAEGAIQMAAGTEVGTYSPVSAPATLDNFLDQGVALKPDFWLTTKATGFGVKDHNVPIEDLGMLGLSLPSDMQAFYGLRVQVNGQAVYYKSADRVTCLKTGKPWAVLLREAAAEGVREYKGFDIRLTALADIKDMKGDVVVKANQTLGYSTSITNYNDIAAFALKVRNANLFNTDLVVKAVCDVRKNDKNKEGWGALLITEHFPMTPEIIAAVAAQATA